MPALRRISAELELPEPAKSRLLLEMAADLEALYEHYRALGVSEAQAGEWAEAKLLASPEALRNLIELHTTSYQRLVSRVAGRMRWGLDLFLFVVGVAPLLAVSATVLARGAPPGGGGILSHALLVVGAVIVAMGSWKAVQIFIRSERSTAVLNRGLFPLLFLGLIGYLLGALGFLLSLYRISLVLGGMHSGTGSAGSALAAEIISGGTVFTLGTLIGITASTIWFVLVNRVTGVERAESAALLGY